LKKLFLLMRRAGKDLENKEFVLVGRP